MLEAATLYLACAKPFANSAPFLVLADHSVDALAHRFGVAQLLHLCTVRLYVLHVTQDTNTALHGDSGVRASAHPQAKHGVLASPAPEVVWESVHAHEVMHAYERDTTKAVSAALEGAVALQARECRVSNVPCRARRQCPRVLVEQGTFWYEVHVVQAEGIVVGQRQFVDTRVEQKPAVELAGVYLLQHDESRVGQECWHHLHKPLELFDSLRLVSCPVRH